MPAAPYAQKKEERLFSVKKYNKALVFVAVSLALAATELLPAGRMPEKDMYTRMLMGTYVTIQLPRGSGKSYEGADLAFDRMKDIYEKFSVFRSGSQVNRLNSRGTPVNDREIIGLTERSIGISVQSEGAFDITIFPVLRTWGFYGGEKKIPSEEELDRAVSLTGYEKVRISEESMGFINGGPGHGLDFGGIAKGYAVDEAALILREQGIEDALIDAGGDIYAMGNNSGRYWRVGIRDPSGNGVVGVIEVSDEAVATSGGYERYFEADGERHHHIFDPRTGYPASTGVASVTVRAPSAELADAWSTAFFVMGAEAALEAAEEMEGIEALIITETGKISSTGGFSMLPY